MSAEPQPAIEIDPCWNRIGIGGDRSCPELAVHVHCRSCPVFSSAARTFFDRPAPGGYLAEWTRLLSQEKQGADVDSVSALVFRLHGEWFAIATRSLIEVKSVSPVHRIPHRTAAILSGLVNIRGQLLLCVSLHGLLGITPGDARESQGGRVSTPRLVVIGSKAERWAFQTEEVVGVQRVARSELRSVSSTFVKAAAGFSKAVFSYKDETIGLLDETRILEALRSLQQ